MIQVKTRTGIDADAGWHMKAKHEEINDKDICSCFVALGDVESEVYVIPALMVAKVVKASHATWLRTPGLKGQKHNDTDMRRIRNEYGMKIKYGLDGWMEPYLEAWSQLD